MYPHLIIYFLNKHNDKSHTISRNILSQLGGLKGFVELGNDSDHTFVLQQHLVLDKAFSIQTFEYLYFKDKIIVKH
jgi:calcineurin-like phosphoesterase family protein